MDSNVLSSIMAEVLNSGAATTAMLLAALLLLAGALIVWTKL
jgi:hypothetical protein